MSSIQTAFTCITCHVAFLNADVQRQHYKSDWHRYNLKRKVVSLLPVSVEDFQAKVAAQQAQAAGNHSQKNVVGLQCKLCQSKFSSFNSHKNHLKSKKHRDAEKREMDNLRKKLQMQPEAHIEKHVTSESQQELEEIAVKKALAEALNNMKQPTILRSADQASNKKEFSKDDNPRLRWYKKQVKLIKESEKEEHEGDSEDWEDLSGDEEEIVEEEFESDVASQTESACTDSSSLPGILSKIKLDSDADIESIVSQGSSSQELLGPKECLFCSRKFASTENNVTHMSTEHCFFLPELAYLIDLEGLLTYLGEKVGVGNVCLWCNEKGHAFYSLKAVRNHMRDKGHCKMFTDGDAALEYADFYDFSSSYPDSDSEDEDSASVVALTDQVYLGDDEDEAELVLPSGSRIGHRSLVRYYKQNFPTIERFHQRTKRPLLERLMAQYKAIGWHGMTGSSVVKKHQRDIRYVQNMKARYREKLGTKNNRTMMKHFRPQVIF